MPRIVILGTLALLIALLAFLTNFVNPSKPTETRDSGRKTDNTQTADRVGPGGARTEEEYKAYVKSQDLKWEAKKLEEANRKGLPMTRENTSIAVPTDTYLEGDWHLKRQDGAAGIRVLDQQYRSLDAKDPKNTHPK
jgi:hypothetical protein